jgi:hypothetical protein
VVKATIGGKRFTVRVATSACRRARWGSIRANGTARGAGPAPKSALPCKGQGCKGNGTCIVERGE